MASIEELQEEFDQAAKAEHRAMRNGSLTPAIESRRDAAERALHAAEDPWMPCTCWVCADPSV